MPRIQRIVAAWVDLPDGRASTGSSLIIQAGGRICCFPEKTHRADGRLRGEWGFNLFEDIKVEPFTPRGSTTRGLIVEDRRILRINRRRRKVELHAQGPAILGWHEYCVRSFFNMVRLGCIIIIVRQFPDGR
jgi:hypothetical protein